MDILQLVVYTSIYIGLFAMVFYVLSFIEGTKRKTPFFKDSELPFVSVIIPAYNEEESTAKTLNSILSSHYPHFEVIFVDDGSKDRTLEIAKTFENEQVKVFHKSNGGKGTALNVGIRKAKGEIIITMDADTFVDPRSMKRMVRYFKDEKIMSVSPAIIIDNPKSILQRIQHMEYLLGLFLRKAFASLNAIYITPGAFSAYRKTFFDKHGDFDEGNVTEDLEMSMRIQSKGYFIENCPEAPVYTIAPKKFKPLLIQRRRWYFGLIKNTINYKHMIGKKYGDLGVFVLPIAWISIFFAVFVTCALFVKTIFDVKREVLFLNSINFDFVSSLNLDFYFVERTLFLFFTNPVFLFICFFLAVLMFYLYYASKKVERMSGLIINLPLFFLFFSVLFGFWWVVSIVYAIFMRDIEWR
jgi:cellulose synthase/poly-beta-1,6-N-acetylglucosamine synthase-like glycosyltransferase